ncbi:MAG: alpha/beta hydrolase [Hyphomonadaceae bacterium]|nr:alpha/beta hydrolase [Hyphomonadaceae bacterium]
MLRTLIGVSALALSLAACSPQAAAPVEPAAAAPETAKMPVELEDKYATSADGTKIHYVASGQGPLIVMVHGFPDYSGSWDKLTPKLNDAYRVVAMDTRGYNLSDKPEGVDNYKMPKLVEDIQAVIKAEGAAKATVLGHDWGAVQAWNYAFTHPETLERLIIMSVPHPALFGRQISQSPENSNYARNFQKEGSENNLTAEGLARSVSDPADKAKYVEAFGRSNFASMMNYYRANYPAAPKPGEAPPTFPKIDVPTLVIHGMKDTALLSFGHNDTWDQITKDTTILMIPDSGHFIQRDAPDLLAAQIRSWLEIHPVN